MKKIIVFLFFIVSICEFSAGQCVSVELSVSWESRDFVFRNEKNRFCYPSLEITYRNTSSQPLYFLKILHPYNDLPRTFYTMYVEPELRANLPRDVDNTGVNYIVNFNDYPTFNQLWEVRNDTINIYDEYGYETDLINDDLYWIYHNIFDTLSNESILSPTFRASFRESDFICEGYPEENIKNRFVFLKPGESYTDTVNLK